MKRFAIKDTEDAGKRLDQYLAAKLTDLSRANVQKLADQGDVLVNGHIQKVSYKLKDGDKVTVSYSANKIAIPIIDIPILYEDQDCIVINKPSGVLVHSKGELNPEATVATFLLPRASGMSGNRAGIVHRLDRPTSGVMICAKNPESLSWLQKQFSTRKVKKYYAAIVQGVLTTPEAIIDMPIERNPKKPQTFRTASNGKPAQTEYRVEKSNGQYSLLELQPKTGRTHQIRVHLQKLGHPIVGDVLYGGEPADRLLLHAQKLEITIPDRQRRIFEAPLPSEFMVYLK